MKLKFLEVLHIKMKLMKELEEDESLPVACKPATGHIIFDVKMDFTRKARWVLDGHKCSDPEGSTYAGVASRENVRT